MTALVYTLYTILRTHSQAFAEMRSRDFAIVEDSLAGEQSAAASQGIDRIIETGQTLVVDNWTFLLIIGLLLMFFAVVGIVRKRRM